MWKETVLVQVEVLSMHLPGGTECNDEESQDNRSPCQNLNPELLED